MLESFTGSPITLVFASDREEPEITSANHTDSISSLAGHRIVLTVHVNYLVSVRKLIPVARMELV